MSQAEDAPQPWPGGGELQALGRVIQAASTFEHVLGEAFCALVGSKYAAVLIGGRTSSGLIGDCKALTKAQRELSDPAKDAIVEALNRCVEANNRRNRLVRDMWAFNPGGISHQLRRERAGYDLVSRAVTQAEIDSVADALTTSAVELNRILFDNLGPGRMALEAQLRWEDAVASMSPGERTRLMYRRLAGMLGEMSRLLMRYHQQSWAKWATETAEVVKSDPDEGLRIISRAYGQGELISITLSGEPSDPGPPWLRDSDPNMQLTTIREQAWQLTNFLMEDPSEGESDPSDD